MLGSLFTQAWTSDGGEARLEELEARRMFAIPPLGPLTLPAGFEQTVFAHGVNTPTAQAFAPDGRLFVLEKAGRVRVIRPDGQLLPNPFVTVPAFSDQDMGLVGIAVDPNFGRSGYVYLYYTTKVGGGALVNRLSRFTASGANADVAAAGSERVILESPMSGIHTGGVMAFGADGMLYLGTGDGRLSSAPQDLGELRGKILRIDVRDGASASPADNPFVGSSGARAEVWASGFRNPFSGAIKPGTNQLYVNDVGESTWEEIDAVVRGGNYGWPAAEGNSTDPRFVNPLYQYGHVSAPTSITGGTFYTAGQFPSEYAGNYFFSDYLNAFISRIDRSGQARPFATGADRPVDLDVGPDGSLYYLSQFSQSTGGADRPVYRIRYVGSQPPPPPPPTPSRKPFSGAPVTVPGVIQAENFDSGGEGIAFHDTTPANEGGLAYRTTPVDLQATTDAGGGAAVGFVRAGEWLEYTVKVGTSGTFDIDFRVAAPTGGGKFHLSVDGVDRTGSLGVPNTGGWQNWATVTKTGVALSAGTHVLRLAFDAAGTTGYVGNFNFVRLRAGGTKPPPPPPPAAQTPFSGTPIVPPGLIEAENFDNGGEGVAFHDTTAGNTAGAYRATDVDLEAAGDTGGGYAVGYVKAGEWLEYTIDVPQAGTYDLDVRLAALRVGGRFHVEAGGVSKTGAAVVPDTGGWQNWRTLTVRGLALAAGRQVLRVSFDAAGATSYVMNLNWLRLRRV